jgi:hypothetical protein
MPTTRRRTVARPIAVAILAAVPLINACGGPSVDTKQAADAALGKVPADAWSALASKRIWFGHQSVGADIMNGVTDLSRERAVPLSEPVETRDPGRIAKPSIAHALNGENEKPDTKIRAFSEFVSEELHGDVDIAFFKFCYVDIEPETDVKALFSDYQAAMGALKAQYPNVRFVHVTSPLTAVQPGWKVALKRLLGRPQKDYAANARRDDFNRLLLAEYQGKEPVFDLARAESTYPDGSRHEFELDGKRYPALIDGYSYDGKHLDEQGRRWVAAHLLVELAQLAR